MTAAAPEPEVVAPEVSTESILAAVDAVYDEAIEFLRTIASVDSTLEKGEGRVQSIVRDRLVEVLGGGGGGGGGGGEREGGGGGTFSVRTLPVRLDDLRRKRGFSPVDWSYDDDQKFDVVARCPGVGGGDDDGDGNDGDGDGDAPRRRRFGSLLLQGHVDVVPASSSDGWTSPPFSPAIENGRMYARGAGDMKAGVVAMIYAVVALQRLGCAPRGEVAICTVVEEECTGNGALAASLEEVLPGTFASGERDGNGKTAVIIPEPFPFLVTAQMGVLWFRATVTGKPCHVLQTSAGSNAIEGAYALYEKLKEVEERYNRPRGDCHPAYRGMDHPVNFNLGRIEGGNWASSVPSRCRFEARAGFPPGMAIDDVKRDVEETLREAAKELGVGVEVSYRGFHADGAVLLPEYVDGRGPEEEDADADGDEGGQRSLQRDFVETMRRCHGLATTTTTTNGRGSDDAVRAPPLPLKPITCTCDARFYSSLYQDPSRVAVTCYGPEAANIHGVDESVSLESVREVMRTLALFVRDWCGLAKGAD